MNLSDGNLNTAPSVKKQCRAIPPCTGNYPCKCPFNTRPTASERIRDARKERELYVGQLVEHLGPQSARGLGFALIDAAYRLVGSESYSTKV